MKNYLAIDLGPDGGFRGLGPLGLEGQAGGSSAISVFSRTISSAIGIMTVIAIIWFIFQFFTGAISIIGAGGDKAKIEAARQKITTGLIGLVVVVVGIFLIDLIGGLLGLEILDIERLIFRLTQQ